MAQLSDLIDDIESLVTCESPSTDPEAVAASADVVARVGAARLGSEPERIVRAGYTHLRWTWGSGRARVLVLGHHDTVWPHGSLAAHPFSMVDGIMRGPGCFDMKAGLVQAFHAIAALPSRDGIVLLVTGDEELASPSSRELIEQQATGCAAVLVLEASADGGALKTARKGASLYDIRIIGRAAHAGLDPEKGVNAAVELAHQVLAIAGFADVTAGTTVTPTVVAAGTTRNTLPGEARIAVDVRVTSLAEQARVDALFAAITPTLAGARLEVSGGPNRPPLERSSSSALYERAVRVATGLGQSAPGQASVGGGSDGNFTAALGIPTLDGLGAVGGGAHADDEHVEVAELVPRTTLLTALLGDLLRDGSP